MNLIVLVGYLAREVEIEQRRGGHLVGRTLLMVPRGRQGRGPDADLVPIVVRGRAEVLAVAELDAGVRVWVTGRLTATVPGGVRGPVRRGGAGDGAGRRLAVRSSPGCRWSSRSR